MVEAQHPESQSNRGGGAERRGAPRKALVAAIAAIVLGAVCLVLYMQRFEEEVSGGSVVSVLVATRDLPLGAQVTLDDLARREVPARYVDSRNIESADANRIVGVRISSRVRADEALLWTDLANGDEGHRDLSSLVEEGKRAYSIRTDVSSSFGGLLRPGDRVDVLLTADERGRGQVAHPIVQNVLVLAAGTDTGGLAATEAGRGGTPSQVALSVTLDQAQLLSVAEERGRLTLVLRNPNDIELVDSPPVRSARDLDADNSELTAGLSP